MFNRKYPILPVLPNAMKTYPESHLERHRYVHPLNRVTVN